MSTATVTRAETATIRLDEQGRVPLDSFVHDLTDISRLAHLVERMSYGRQLDLSPTTEDDNEDLRTKVVAVRYGSPLEVVLGMAPQALLVMGGLALFFERTTAGIRNIADASMKRAEARRANVDTDRMLAEAETALASATAADNNEMASLRIQQAELIKMLAEAHRRIDDLESVGIEAAPSEDEQHASLRREIRSAWGDDLADRFDTAVPDAELDTIVDLLDRLSSKRTTIQIRE
ncbi:hypothetical protein ACFCVO_15870 [Agromyces sp. NPDC056379]|uniref:hypothetical protein n=1 Tax=unclassified Agromyces TaxID=2639701 RepID=UPI0035DBB9BE